MLNLKVCSKCGKEKLNTVEFFHKAKTNKDGLRGQCRDCVNEYKRTYRLRFGDNEKKYKKQYYEKNKDAILEKRKAYQENNKLAISEYKKQYHKENKDFFREYKTKYNEENKDAISKYKQEYYEANKDTILYQNKLYREKNKSEIAEYSRQYSKDNPYSYRKSSQRRRALKLGLPNTLTIEEWWQTKAYFSNSCSYCGLKEEEHMKNTGQPLHQEHVIALSKGGGYTKQNIIPSCMSCNFSKGSKDFQVWYREQAFYSERRETEILKLLEN